MSQIKWNFYFAKGGRIMSVYYTTAGITNMMEESRDFRRFVTRSFERFINNDWGNVSEHDGAMNDADKETAMGSYEQENMPTIWIKRDIDIITILFPDEW